MTVITRLQTVSTGALTVRRTHIFIALTIFLLLWRIPYYGKFVLDDPFITFRYGLHLFEQGQFTFNLDEYILATTTPVYGLIATLFEALRLPPAPAATILNLGFEIALLYVLGQMIAEFKLDMGSVAYIVTGLLVITNRAMSIASNSGMETPLFTLLNLLTVLWIIRRDYMKGAVSGSLATLTRPDGIFVLVLLGLTILVRERRLPLREVGLSILIGAPWAIIATLTYGSPISQSVVAKDAIAEIWNSNLLLNNLHVVFYEPLRFFALFSIPPMLWAVYRLIQPAWWTRGGPLIAFALMHLGYMALPNNLGFEWYFAPLYTTLNLLIGLGLALMLAEGRWKQILAGISVLGITAGIVYSTVGNYVSVHEIDSIWRDGMFQVIDYLNENAPADSVIQSTNIGILGYHTDFYILDPLGLASTATTALIDSATSLAHLQQLSAATLQPDYIVNFGPGDYPGYEVVREFPTQVISLFVYQRSG